MELSKEEKEAIYISICCRIGIIETGEAMLTAQDAINSGQQKLIKPLSRSQRDLLNLLDDIKNKMLS